MSKDKLTDYDATASNNTDVGGVSVAEGMLPSAVNNAIREQMSHLKDFAAGTAGIDVLSLADDDASHAIKLQAPSAVTANTTFTLPDGDGANGQTMITDGAGTLSWAAPYGNRNLVINGEMAVWQRQIAATAAVNTAYATVDRFKFYISNDGAYTSEQSTDVPSGQGFNKSLKLAVTTADTSIAAAQYAFFATVLEGQNLQRLRYGTSNAESITVSFWVKSNKTGTYGLTATTVTTTYAHFQNYTINSANTWEKKTITISPTAGSTTLITSSGGAITNDNTVGFQLFWNLAFGTDYHGTENSWTTSAHYSNSNQVNWMDSTSNNFYLTGVQMEVGSGPATPFEHEDIGTTLRKCQRYYYKISVDTQYDTFMVADNDTTTTANGTNSFPVTMRASPTALETSGTAAHYEVRTAGSSVACNDVPTLIRTTTNTAYTHFITASVLTAGNASTLRAANTSAYLAWSAEI